MRAERDKMIAEREKIKQSVVSAQEKEQLLELKCMQEEMDQIRAKMEDEQAQYIVLQSRIEEKQKSLASGKVLRPGATPPGQVPGVIQNPVFKVPEVPRVVPAPSSAPAGAPGAATAFMYSGQPGMDPSMQVYANAATSTYGTSGQQPSSSGAQNVDILKLLADNQQLAAACGYNGQNIKTPDEDIHLEVIDHLYRQRIGDAYVQSTMDNFRLQSCAFINFCNAHRLVIFPPQPLTVARFLTVAST